MRRPAVRFSGAHHRIDRQHHQQNHQGVNVRALGGLDDDQRVPKVDKQTLGRESDGRQQPGENKRGSQIEQDGR